MEANIRMMPREEIQIEQNPNFSHIVRSSDSIHSFYLCLGMAFFESLTRLKSVPRVVDPIWDKVTQIFNQSASEEDQNTRILSSLVRLLRRPEDPVYKSLNWLGRYLTTNKDSVTEALLIGMKRIFCHILSSEVLSIHNNHWPADPPRYLKSFADYFRVHIFIPNLNHKISCNTDGPLLCLHHFSANCLGVSYHREHIHIEHFDKSDLIDRFPFYVSVRSPDPPPDDLVQMLQSLAKYIMNSTGDRMLDKQEIKKCTEIYRELSSGHFKEMSNFLEHCPHTNTRIVSPRCGKPHCSECMFEKNIKLNPPLCDCGKELTEEEIQNIRGIISLPGLPSTARVNPPTMEEISGIPVPPLIQNNQGNAQNIQTASFANPPLLNGHPQNHMIHMNSGIGTNQSPLQNGNPGTRPVTMPNPNASRPVQEKSDRMLPNERTERPRNFAVNSHHTRNYSRNTMPAIPGQRICAICKHGKDNEDFESLMCLGHQVCSQCRAFHYKNGNMNCPHCCREYSYSETEILTILMEQFGLTSPNQIHSFPEEIPRNEEFKCLVCYEMKTNRYQCPQNCPSCTDCSVNSCEYCMESFKIHATNIIR